MELPRIDLDGTRLTSGEAAGSSDICISHRKQHSSGIGSMLVLHALELLKPRCKVHGSMHVTFIKTVAVRNFKNLRIWVS